MMADGGGRVVNVASIVGFTGYSGLSVYSATKASLIGFTRSLAREVGRLGVNVNAVAPGFLDTEMTQGLDGEQPGAGGAPERAAPVSRSGRRRRRSRVSARIEGQEHHRDGAHRGCGQHGVNGRDYQRLSVSNDCERSRDGCAACPRQAVVCQGVVARARADRADCPTSRSHFADGHRGARREVRRRAGPPLRRRVPDVSCARGTIDPICPVGDRAGARQGRRRLPPDAEPPRVHGHLARHHPRRRRRCAAQHESRRALARALHQHRRAQTPDRGRGAHRSVDRRAAGSRRSRRRSGFTAPVTTNFRASTTTSNDTPATRWTTPSAGR